MNRLGRIFVKFESIGELNSTKTALFAFKDS